MSFQLLALAAGGLIAFRALRKGVNATSINAEIVGIEALNPAGLTEFVARVRVRFTNPTGSQYRVRNAFFQLLKNGSQFGTVNSTEPVEILPTSTKEAIFSTRLSTLDMLSLGGDLWRTGSTKVDTKGRIEFFDFPAVPVGSSFNWQLPGWLTSLLNMGGRTNDKTQKKGKQGRKGQGLNYGTSSYNA